MVIGPIKFDAGISYNIRLRTSGLNRKLSVFVFKRVKISGFDVEFGVIRPSEFDAGIRFHIHPRTSGLNRKLSVLVLKRVKI